MSITRRAQLPDLRLDRSSFVPLYHQLYEVLKEQIDAGRWTPGDLMPSEPELCRHFTVSRMVVRQALGILEDDGRVVRHRGRGTFVSELRFEHRAGGLVRLLQLPRQRGLSINVLDNSLPGVEETIRRRLGIDTGVRRITAQLSLAGQPIAVSYSYLDPERAPWVEAIPTIGVIPTHVEADDFAMRLGRSDLGIEVGQCDEFESSQLGLAERSSVLSVAIAEFAEGDENGNPLEIAQVRYRGDRLQCRLELAPGPFPAITARFAFGGGAGNV